MQKLLEIFQGNPQQVKAFVLQMQTWAFDLQNMGIQCAPYFALYALEKKTDTESSEDFIHRNLKERGKDVTDHVTELISLLAHMELKYLARFSYANLHKKTEEYFNSIKSLEKGDVSNAVKVISEYADTHVKKLNAQLNYRVTLIVNEITDSSYDWRRHGNTYLDPEVLKYTNFFSNTMKKSSFFIFEKQVDRNIATLVIQYAYQKQIWAGEGIFNCLLEKEFNKQCKIDRNLKLFVELKSKDRGYIKHGSLHWEPGLGLLSEWHDIEDFNYASHASDPEFIPIQKIADCSLKKADILEPYYMVPDAELAVLFLNHDKSYDEPVCDNIQCLSGSQKEFVDLCKNTHNCEGFVHNDDNFGCMKQNCDLQQSKQTGNGALLGNCYKTKYINDNGGRPSEELKCGNGEIVADMFCLGPNCQFLTLECCSVYTQTAKKEKHADSLLAKEKTKWTSCKWTDWTSDKGNGDRGDWSEELGPEYFIAGIQCKGNWCDDVRPYMCTLKNAAFTGETTSMSEKRSVSDPYWGKQDLDLSNKCNKNSALKRFSWHGRYSEVMSFECQSIYDTSAVHYQKKQPISLGKTTQTEYTNEKNPIFCPDDSVVTKFITRGRYSMDVALECKSILGVKKTKKENCEWVELLANPSGYTSAWSTTMSNDYLMTGFKCTDYRCSHSFAYMCKMGDVEYTGHRHFLSRTSDESPYPDLANSCPDNSAIRTYKYLLVRMGGTGTICLENANNLFESQFDGPEI
eukprot:Pgem_evm1s2286